MSPRLPLGDRRILAARVHKGITAITLIYLITQEKTPTILQHNQCRVIILATNKIHLLYG